MTDETTITLPITEIEVIESPGDTETLVEQALVTEVLEVFTPGESLVEVLEIPPDTEAIVESIEVIEILEAAEQGPPGRDGGGAQAGIPFAFGDATPSLLGLFAGTVVAVSIVILTPFNGVGAELSITSPSATLIGAAQSLPGEFGRYETSPGLRLATPTALSLNITPGLGASAGSGIVYLEIAS